jgi:hypothetical protein
MMKEKMRDVQMSSRCSDRHQAGLLREALTPLVSKERAARRNL